MAFQLLRVGGAMLFDDYAGGEGAKMGVDAFVASMGGAVEVIESRFTYQLLVVKREE